MKKGIKLLIAILLFPLYISVFLSLLIFWEIILRITPSRIQNRIVRAFNRTIYESLKILGTTYKVKGKMPQITDRPCIIVSNHQSMFDMPWLYTVFHKYHPRYVAKIELAKKIPGISICLKKGGSALIDRKNSKQAINEIQALANRMKDQGFSTIIFPEGTRARDGNLKKFKANGIKELCLNLQKTAIIPVALDNSWKLMRYKYGPIPVFCKLKMKIGNPVLINEKLDVDPGIEKAFNEIHLCLEDLRRNN